MKSHSIPWNIICFWSMKQYQGGKNVLIIFRRHISWLPLNKPVLKSLRISHKPDILFVSCLLTGMLWFQIMSEQRRFLQQCRLTQIVCFYSLSQLVKVTLTIIGTCDIPQYYCISHPGTVSGLCFSSGSDCAFFILMFRWLVAVL